MTCFASRCEIEGPATVGEDPGKRDLPVTDLFPDWITEVPAAPPPAVTWSNSSGWLTGSVLSITASIRLKTVVTN
jgi:hypothetical protein